MSSGYSRDFFTHQNGALRSARRMLPIVFDLTRPRTMVDVGCGIGAWAKAGKELGCVVTGLDGDWVPRDQLLIDEHEFVPSDLSAPAPLSTQFDLAVSLEVAEHLDSSVAEKFVRFVASLAPVVLFSAAVPWQRGTGHVNEQYPPYWVDLFQRCGFTALDAIRPRCWHDHEIEFYYRQNVLLFLAPSRIVEVEAAAGLRPAQHPLDVIHPDAVPILAQGWVEAGGTRRCVGLLGKTVARSLRKRFGFA
jgi:SAM-dependent methyltransferase